MAAWSNFSTSTKSSTLSIFFNFSTTGSQVYTWEPVLEGGFPLLSETLWITLKGSLKLQNWGLKLFRLQVGWRWISILRKIFNFETPLLGGGRGCLRAFPSSFIYSMNCTETQGNMSLKDFDFFSKTFDQILAHYSFNSMSFSIYQLYVLLYLPTISNISLPRGGQDSIQRLGKN